MSRKYTGGVYVPQLNFTFSSIAEAAHELAIDASNISKVLRGKRQSVGGYNFVPATAAQTPQELQEIGEKIIEATPKKKQERMERTRKKNEGKISPTERARRKAKREKATKLHHLLVGINQKIRELEKEGLAGYSDAVSQLANFKAIIGTNKIGGFDTSMQNLMTLSEEQIDAAITEIEHQQKRLEKTKPETLQKKRAAVAFQFGITQEELEEYDDMLPILWDLLALARSQQGNDYEQSLYNAVVEAVGNARDANELREMLIEIKNEYQANMEDATGDDLNDILQRGADKLQSKYKTPEEAAAEEANEEVADAIKKAQEEQEEKDNDDDDWLGDGWVTIIS